MALLPILEFPDERLRKKAAAVEEITPDIVNLIDDMLETMYAAPGIGLAATQVNVQQRIIVMDLSEEKNQPLVLINPTLASKAGTEESEEGLRLFAEHTESARQHPGSHPNIDRLFEVIASGQGYSVRTVTA